MGCGDDIYSGDQMAWKLVVLNHDEPRGWAWDVQATR